MHTVLCNPEALTRDSTEKKVETSPALSARVEFLYLKFKFLAHLKPTLKSTQLDGSAFL